MIKLLVYHCDEEECISFNQTGNEIKPQIIIQYNPELTEKCLKCKHIFEDFNGMKYCALKYDSIIYHMSDAKYNPDLNLDNSKTTDVKPVTKSIAQEWTHEETELLKRRHNEKYHEVELRYETAYPGKRTKKSINNMFYRINTNNLEKKLTYSDEEMMILRTSKTGNIAYLRIVERYGHDAKSEHAILKKYYTVKSSMGLIEVGKTYAYVDASKKNNGITEKVEVTEILDSGTYVFARMSDGKIHSALVKYLRAC